MHKSLVPSAEILPTHGSVPQLVEEMRAGLVDVALVTLPLKHPDLRVEEPRRDRLVACLRKDSQLAEKGALSVGDLREHLRVFYHPQRHPEAHDRLLELLGNAGIQIREHSRASHPFDMQTLVREGFGIALVREGTPLDDQLTTRPILGVDWIVDIALIYHKDRHPKTVPVLVCQLQKQSGKSLPKIDIELDPICDRSLKRQLNGSV